MLPKRSSPIGSIKKIKPISTSPSLKNSIELLPRRKVMERELKIEL
jgi:hypothetical protein